MFCFFFRIKEKRFTYIDTLATLVITLLSHIILDMLCTYSLIYLFILFDD